ncbi:MAG: HAMP domain-containing protein [Chloroflexi bacterium]|nr:HAMP domain-containing protein [Chloroflexota bacterium]
MPINSLEQHIIQDLQIDLATSSLITLLVTAGVYFLVHRLIVRRVEALRQPLAAYAGGEFTARLPVGPAASDELDELAGAFNRMADELVRHAREERERSELRQRAIVEERERIARELHDGMAQLLGYVNTKAMAARLLLKKRRIAAADEHLAHLEQAARDLFVDVREAILGLKVTGGTNGGLAPMLEKYVAQFSQLSGVPVAVEIAPAAREQPLNTEIELQLLRIVQEALTNIRKHARASLARLDLHVSRNGSNMLELTVTDDGQGFQPEKVHAHGRPHFGLGTMRERAEAIGAEFDLQTSPGAGTRVSVRLSVKES